MTRVYDLQEHDRLLDDVSLWISRIDRGLSADEEAQLKSFLGNPDARARFLEMAEHWDKLDSLSRLADIMPAFEGQPTRKRWRLAAAASILAAVVVAGVLLHDIGGPESPDSPMIAGATYETAVGEQSVLQLADGSEVLLNTNSKVVVSLTNTGRLVVMERGEAHFDVAKDPSRPFSVSAGPRLFQAVGTQFSVEMTNATQIELIVIEGAVRVAAQRMPPNGGSLDPLPELLAEGATIKAVSIATLANTNDIVAAIDIDTIETKLSWRTGDLVFEGESLEAAMTEISRYTDIEFVFLNEDTRLVEVGGLFRTGDIDGLLDSLQANFGISYQRVGDNKVLLSGQ